MAPRSASAFSSSSPNHSAKCGSFFSSASALVFVAISMNWSTKPRRSSATPNSISVVDWSSIAFKACSACAYSLLKYSKVWRASSERSSGSVIGYPVAAKSLRQRVEIGHVPHHSRANNVPDFTEVRDVERRIAADNDEIGIFPLLDCAGPLVQSHRPARRRRRGHDHLHRSHS